MFILHTKDSVIRRAKLNMAGFALIILIVIIMLNGTGKYPTDEAHMKAVGERDREISVTDTTRITGITDWELKQESVIPIHEANNETEKE